MLPADLIDPSQETTLQAIMLTLIAPSPTNPRHRHQNQASNLKAWNLNELAESIRQHGVMQPITVRPNPEHREGDGRPLYELVAGERRWRASQLAGRATILAMVHQLSDFETLELQIIENTQREDLHPLEEAEGYERLIRKPNALQGYANAEELAARLGKSPRHVYNRLKLLTLCPAARDACEAGSISASVALEIANAVPDAIQQAKATQEVLAGWGGEPFSARSARAHLKKHYMLRLDQARFEIGAIYTLAQFASSGSYCRTVNHGADTVEVGPCSSCPKRTGAHGDFFDDVKEGDLCQDSACFAAKTAQAHQDLLNAAREAGAQVIIGEPAKRMMGNGTRPQGHQLLDQPCIAFSDYPKSLRAAVGDAIDSRDMVFIDATGSDLVMVVSDETAQRALKAKGLLKITAPMAAPAKKAAKLKDKGGTLFATVGAVPRRVEAADTEPDVTDPLFEGLLQFEVLPERAKSGKMLNDTALKSCTITAERRATAVLIAQAVSKRLRHGGEEGLPQHGLGNVLLVDLLLSDCYVTPELAAQLVDIDQAFPAPGGYDRLAEWAWALDDETATRLALMLLVLQDAGPSQVISRFPSAVGAALGVDTAALVMQAESMVRERLRLELVKRGSVAVPARKAAPGTKMAAKYRCRETGEAWTGRGLQPKWLKVALTRGKTLADFAVSA